MASPGELADTLSRSLGVKLGTINFYGQELRNEKLLTTGGRGPAAADMSCDDAVNWLIAMCAAETAKSAPAVVRATRNAPLREIRAPQAPDDFAFLKARTVGELLSFLLDDAQSRRLDNVNINIDFYVGGGFVECKAGGTDHQVVSTNWDACMEFVFSTAVIRDKDPKEFPVGSKRKKIIRISGDVFNDISEALEVPVPNEQGNLGTR